MMKGNNVKTSTTLGPSFCALCHIQFMHCDQQATGQANKPSTEVNKKVKRGPRHAHTAKSGYGSQQISSVVLASNMNVRVLTLWLITI